MIVQSLIDLAEKLRAADGTLSPDSMLCQQAATLILDLDTANRKMPREHFYSTFNAVLTGIYARGESYRDFVDDAAIMDEAWSVAQMASRRRLEEPE